MPEDSQRRTTFCSRVDERLIYVTVFLFIQMVIIALDNKFVFLPKKEPKVVFKPVIPDYGEVKYKPIHCYNSGHFYTEDLPNILLKNVSVVCSECLPSFKEMVAMMTTRPIVYNITGCDIEENPKESNRTFNCFMPHICNVHRKNNRVHNLIDGFEVQRLYESVQQACNVTNLKREYDVVLFHRLSTRKVLNYHLLVTALNKANISNIMVNSSFISSLSQCEILALYQKAGVVIGPYGSDLTYSVLLGKPTFPFMSKYATEPFYEVMRAELRLHSPYRIVLLEPFNETVKSVQRIETFEYWRIQNYLNHDFVLSESDVNDLLVLVRQGLM